MDMVSPWNNKDTSERDVPVIRLEKDADLREIYEFGRKLGQGSFGVAYEATHNETQTKWAIKEVCKPAAGSSKVEMLEHEINILKQVNHDHIIYVKEVYDTPRMMYLVTELCSGGELRQLLQRKRFFTEDETRQIIRNLADAVAYLHKKNIMHRDLKLENILVKNSPDVDDNDRINIKVTDFGLSVRIAGVGLENILNEACGTLSYMAPEMMSGRGYSLWCDVWSIGVVMYMLLCGEPPFVSKKKTNLLQEIMEKEVTFTQPIWATVSDAAKHVLTCLLKADPAYRMSANQLLESPWITGDTNVPVIQSNVLDLMRTQLEEKERSKTLDNLSLTSWNDTLSPVPKAASLETNINHKNSAKFRCEKDSSFCRTSTSTIPLQPKNSGGFTQHRNGFETSGLSQTTATQCHAGVKTAIQLTAKQPRPQEKKNLSTAQKAASDPSKTDNHRIKTVLRNPSAGFRTCNHTE